MSYRNTIIVLVVLAALIAFVYYNDQQQNASSTSVPTLAPETLVLDLKADDVVRIEVSTPVSRTVLHRANDVWMLDEPITEEADTSRLNTSIAGFARLKATRTLTDTPTNLAPFGLVTGTLTLTLQLKDNRSETIRFGNAGVGGGSYYVQHVGDAKVYFVSSSIFGDAQGLLTQTPKKPTPTPVPPTETPATTETPQGPPVPPPPTATGTPNP